MLAFRCVFDLSTDLSALSTDRQVTQIGTDCFGVLRFTLCDDHSGA